MATSIQETEFQISRKLDSMSDLKYPQIPSAGDVYVNYKNDSEDSMHHGIRNFSICAGFTAKRECGNEIIANLKSVSRGVEGFLVPELKEMGYSVTIVPVTMKAIEHQFEDYESGSEHGFGCVVAEVSITVKAMKALIAQVKAELEQSKATPKYVKYVNQYIDNFGKSNKFKLDLNAQTVNGVSFSDGGEVLADHFESMALDRINLASMLKVRCPHYGDNKFELTDEVISSKEKLLTHIDGQISFNNENYNLTVYCLRSFQSITVTDVNGKDVTRQVCTKSSFQDKYFLYQTKAQMKKIVSTMLNKGAKISSFEPKYMTKKVVHSPFTKFSEVTLITHQSYLSKFLVIKFNKKGELTVTDLNGVIDEEENTRMNSLIAADTKNLVKTVFCANKYFASRFLTHKIGFNNDAVIKSIF